MAGIFRGTKIGLSGHSIAFGRAEDEGSEADLPDKGHQVVGIGQVLDHISTDEQVGFEGSGIKTAEAEPVPVGIGIPEPADGGLHFDPGGFQVLKMFQEFKAGATADIDDGSSARLFQHCCSQFIHFFLPFFPGANGIKIFGLAGVVITGLDPEAGFRLEAAVEGAQQAEKSLGADPLKDVQAVPKDCWLGHKKDSRLFRAGNTVWI